MKKILYIDMHNVLVDFPSAFPHLSKTVMSEYDSRLDEVPGIFSLMEPMTGAIDAFTKLSKMFPFKVISSKVWEYYYVSFVYLFEEILAKSSDLLF